MFWENQILCNERSLEKIIQKHFCEYTYPISRQYNNTYEDFPYKDFTYNINKCDITFVFLFTTIFNL
jgi:hypothetical protein